MSSNKMAYRFHASYVCGCLPETLEKRCITRPNYKILAIVNI